MDHKQPFWKKVVAGGSAGIAEILVMYPTDVIKTRAQLSTASVSMWGAVRGIVAKEGAATLYRGIGSPILAEAPKRAVKFSTNELYKSALKDADGRLPWYRAFVAGAMAGGTEMFFNCPFEVVKVRMQAPESRQLYKSTADCLVQLLRAEGLRGLYRGGESQLWRNAAWNGVYFGIIGTVHDKFPAPEDPQQKMAYNFVTGLLGGALATTASTPIDVVKSRIQNQRAGAAPKYVWTLPSLATIYREEGFRACYKGYGPRLLRLGPGGGIMLVAYRKVSELLEPL